MDPEVLIGEHALKQQYKLCFPSSFREEGQRLMKFVKVSKWSNFVHVVSGSKWMSVHGSTCSCQ